MHPNNNLYNYSHIFSNKIMKKNVKNHSSDQYQKTWMKTMKMKMI